MSFGFSRYSLRKLQVIPLASVPIKCTLHNVMTENVLRKLHIHQKKEKKEKRRAGSLFYKRKCVPSDTYKTVRKYQRHYERFFGDETKVQKSQGNRANERKQSSSCLRFPKDNRPATLNPARVSTSGRRGRAAGAARPRVKAPSQLSVRTKA